MELWIVEHMGPSCGWGSFERCELWPGTALTGKAFASDMAAPLAVEVALSVDLAECEDSQSPVAGLRERE